MATDTLVATPDPERGPPIIYTVTGTTTTGNTVTVTGNLDVGHNWAITMPRWSRT